MNKGAREANEQLKYPYDEHCIDCKPGKLPQAIKDQLDRIKKEVDRLMSIKDEPVPYSDLLMQYRLYESIIKIHFLNLEANAQLMPDLLKFLKNAQRRLNYTKTLGLIDTKLNEEINVAIQKAEGK